MAWSPAAGAQTPDRCGYATCALGIAARAFAVVACLIRWNYLPAVF